MQISNNNDPIKERSNGIKVEISYLPAIDTPKMEVKAKKIANKPKSSGAKILANTGLRAKGINCEINEPIVNVDTALKKEFCKILNIFYRQKHIGCLYLIKARYNH